MCNFISDEPNENGSLSESTEICDYDIQKKKKKTISKKSPNHTLRRKRQKISVEHSNKLFDYFRLMIVYPPPKLDSEESNIISGCFGISSENQSNEIISKMVLTHILNRWD